MADKRASEGMEVSVFGPILLTNSEPNLLFWTAKVGQFSAGSAKLCLDQAHHTAQLRDLQISSDTPSVRQSVSGKLLHAIADYAREHGVLKLKVHRNSAFDWVAGQLSRLGFSDARRNDGRMHFYVDIYRPVRKRRLTQPESTPIPNSSKLAS